MSWHSYLDRFTKGGSIGASKEIDSIVRVCYTFSRLPNDWRQAQTDGCIFFYRIPDRVTTWAHPIDQILAFFIERVSENPTMRESELREVMVGSASFVLTCDTCWIEAVTAELWKTYTSNQPRILTEENESCSSFGSCSSNPEGKVPSPASYLQEPVGVNCITTSPDVVLESHNEDVTFSSSQFMSAS